MTTITAMKEKFSQYACPEVLVSTEWVATHLQDKDVCVIESNEDVLLYGTGHIEGAIHIDWRSDLQEDVMRDYISPEAFAELCSKHGITPETLCVFYGDKSNWWACYALWVFRLFGHKNVAIMDGGRQKWIQEGRSLSKKPAMRKSSNYSVPQKRLDGEIRAFYEDALAQSQTRRPLVDVRSPGEFSGEVTHMPNYPQEGVLRGGHIPGAQSCPWSRAANEDATFKGRKELEAIYAGELKLNSKDDVVVYCRIGERSSHTWFVLTYLLGFKSVRNYDGSWTEWGNRVRSPIERTC